MCGEYIALRFTVGMYLGSPPHTWRIQYPALSTAEPLRITSTYVENTNFLAMYQMDYQGSPPHTWRILSKSKSGKHHRLITSTYVENTRNVESLVNALKDHLHIRGEYLLFVFSVRFIVGSPPHTWRIHALRPEFSNADGITSTYVENTDSY